MIDKLNAVITLIDGENADDPFQTVVNGSLVGTEILYAQRMFNTLNALVESPSEPLTLACYAQHVCRWRLVRKDYPEGLAGYRTWRTDSAKLHATILSKNMLKVGYSHDEVTRASHIIQKRKLKSDAETQTLEDVSCLVFLSYYFDAFAQKHSEERIIDIVQKTWGKMSEKGHAAALALTLPSHLQLLVNKALGA